MKTLTMSVPITHRTVSHSYIRFIWIWSLLACSAPALDPLFLGTLHHSPAEFLSLLTFFTGGSFHVGCPAPLTSYPTLRIKLIDLPQCLSFPLRMG